MAGTMPNNSVCLIFQGQTTLDSKLIEQFITTKHLPLISVHNINLYATTQAEYLFQKFRGSQLFNVMYVKLTNLKQPFLKVKRA